VCRHRDAEFAVGAYESGDDAVCKYCGLVLRTVHFPDLWAHSIRRAARARATYRRPIHFRERLRSWTGRDPRIFSAWLVRLRAAYERLQETPLWLSRGERGRLITPDDVRAIITEAGLSKKQLTEKHVSIRWHLQHYMRPHQPTDMQMDDIDAMYAHFASLWEKLPELRNGRSNVINLNLVIMQFILRCCGQEAYDTHLPDFVQLGDRNWAAMFNIFTRIARKGDWIPSCPVRPIPKLRVLPK
jgi:hypothetical protein